MPILNTCDYCNKEYKARAYSLKRSKRHFCSNDCANKFRSERRPREEQPTFNPNLTDEDRKRQLRAQTLAYSAIRWGKIKRGSCEICGKQNAHSHHDDYDKPYDIRWLCPEHHLELHTKLRREEKRALREAI